MITSEAIKNRLWAGANELRGAMDASRYKDYMLGLMFYKFLSDKTLETFRTTSGLKKSSPEDLVKAYAEAYEQFGQNLTDMINQVLGYHIEPQYLYHKWIEDINNGTFEVQKIIDSLNNFERNIQTTADADDFIGLFSNSNLDLTDTALGSDLKTRSGNIKELILLFADLDMVALQRGDILGDAYEYLIGQFAMESGKKAGEFYTPAMVSEVMAQIVAKSCNGKITSIYDPTVGSGSLLLTVAKHLDKDSKKNLSYYGQEKNTSTYNLTRMNLLLHDVLPGKMTIKNGDTLAQDWPEDPERPNEGVQFDAVVMNPPYSLKNWNKAGVKVSDPRFQVAGVLPPDNKGDYAFLMHGLYHLGTNGTMAIVLPHGVLFRGASEGTIREKLLEKNYIDAIIGLPNNLFTNTGIPVIVMILKKNRNLGEPVLIIDASKDFIKEGKQNVLQEKDIARIVDTYINRTEKTGYSHLASREEILANDSNLNIPRYVTSLDEEIPYDVDACLFGGIPKENIKSLEILNNIAGEILNDFTDEIRDGYVSLNKSIEDLTKEILQSEVLKKEKEDIKNLTKEYVAYYWDKLKSIESDAELNVIREEMLNEIKNALKEYENIDIYEGYQIIAEVWKESLHHDLEIIQESDFYDAAKSVEANMVTKGSGKNKREEQDGWKGTIIPNDSLKVKLYKDEIDAIETKKNKIAEIDSEIEELSEKAKEEDSIEANTLGSTLGESGEVIENKLVKEELKKVSKGTEEYSLLNKVANLFKSKASINKEIKNDEVKLDKKVEESYADLTEEQIDEFVFDKWFGKIENKFMELVENPVKKELEILRVLHERYKETITELDNQIADLENELAAMMSELVVV